MVTALACIAVVGYFVAAIVPSRDELAREIAERNDRCGHVTQDGFICLLPKHHQTEHVLEPTTRTVPID